MKEMVDQVQLNDNSDRVRWRIGSSGKFSVKDLYFHLRSGGVFPHIFMWKLKVPLKVKVFMWLMIKDRILTRNNLTKRGWTGNTQCHFCATEETVDHLIFQCSLAKMIWQIVVCALDLPRAPVGVDDMLNGWLDAFPTNQKKLVLGGCAAICWTIWKTRNDACFNRKFPNDPAAVVYRLCALLNSWAIL